ncbi:alpha/beta fold hydrolase [Sulfurimonas aquatica]|uniref:Alpha/beta fold hydrolase n=1 Tax=Sulfurimonas aquatica TaxID=2672570 RepID=A0A975GBU1_9BACT|nr:alpha/beta fold hydrolase [Sulfurimonas aquatica]QSZ40583.1 alpha/beta fold hydrolase [Sulfurimonas aquatica]
MKKFALLLLLSLSSFASELTITSEDGFKLYGYLDKPQTSKSKTPIILFAHQFGSDHSSWNNIAKKFNDKGYATLLVDLRGHGKSIYQNNKKNEVVTATKFSEIKVAHTQSDKKVTFKNIPQDLTNWLEYISDDESLDMENLYLFGSSLGAGSIISLLNEYDAKALVAISTGRQASLKEETNMALSTSMTKELFIASKNDPLGAKERTLLYTQKSILGTALIVSGNGHGTMILPQVEDYIFTFIENIK